MGDQVGDLPPLDSKPPGNGRGNMGKLTARKVQTAGPGKHEDGDGLRLVVSPSGGRKWVLRVTVDGKRRELGLGSYPTVSLSDARDKAQESRKAVAQGLDPVVTRARKPTGLPTFEASAEQYIAAHSPGWRNEKHLYQWNQSLGTFVYPLIGTKTIDQIVTEDVLKVLQPIWTTKTETASRVQGRIERVLDWATARKFRTGENPARWKGHLDTLLPSPRKVKRVTHYPAMPYTDVPEFMTELYAKPGVSALALRLLILTACRTGEVIRATWSEIDQDSGVWTIPPVRMKMEREHRVPLTEAALLVLKALPRVEGNPYLFPGAKNEKPISNMALLQLMRGMDYGVGGTRGAYVPHGFRSSFRDWAGEVSSFPRDVCEMALAHAIESRVEAAYRRGDLFEKRRKMMEEWANWCTQVRTTESIEKQ